MDEAYLTRLASKLCSADMVCGYISVRPVLDNRDELIAKRLDYYHVALTKLWNELLAEGKVNNALPEDPLLESAVDLTSADMVSEAISLDPVLYARDEKVIEHLVMYMNKLTSSYPNKLPTPKLTDSVALTDIVVAPIVAMASAVASETGSKGKKKKNRR